MKCPAWLPAFRINTPDRGFGDLQVGLCDFNCRLLDGDCGLIGLLEDLTV
jgi:hypothetical protein